MGLVQERQSLARSRLISGIARVDLRVQDVERSLGFYRDIVGLEVADLGDSSATLRSQGGEVFLTLDSTGVTAAADPTSTGLFHTAFRYPSRAALGDALARLVEAGYEVGAGDHLVSEALYVDDPDGNGVELYWDRPVEEWPAPTDEALVPMATLPVDLHALYRRGGGTGALHRAAPQGTDVGHVHLQVSDVDQTIRFYVELLGLDLTGRMGGSASFFSSNGYHHNIGANSWRSRGGRPSGKERAGLERVVFAIHEAVDLQDLWRRLSEDAYDVSESATELVVRDPDGIELRFEIAEHTERGAHHD